MEETALVQADNLIDLLDRIAPPAEPAPIAMIPQTWGWAVLGLLLLALTGWGIRRYLRHRRRNAYRRAALRMLGDCGDAPARIAEVLRRTALTAYPRTDVASLSGEAWLYFLDSHAKGADFVAGGQALALAPYKTVAADPALTRRAMDWVRSHRREDAS